MEEEKQELRYRQAGVAGSEWSVATTFDEFIQNGVYEIKVINDAGTLNLPFRFTGDDVAQLVVSDNPQQGKLQQGRSIAQTLVMAGSNGNEYKNYTRTAVFQGSNIVWDAWSKLQQNVEVGQVTSLDSYIDNGLYSGVYTNGTTMFETFVMVVINNYAVAAATGKERSVSQFKYALNVDRNFSYKTRTGQGSDKITWGSWVDLGAATTTDIQDGAVTAEKLSAELKEIVNAKMDKSAIVQTIGYSDDMVLNQKAVSERIIYNKEKLHTGNGTPENSGNALAVMSTDIIPVKKGDKIVVKVIADIPDGMEIRYGFAGVNSFDKKVNIGTNKTEGPEYGTGNSNNYYIFKKDNTVGVLFCVVLYNVNTKEYISIQDRNVELYASVVPEEMVARRRDGIRFVAAPGFIPKVNALNFTLDLGEDCGLLIGEKVYLLKNYGDSHRNISLKHSSGSSATKVLFDIDSHTFKTEMYNYINLPSEVTICSQRLSSNKVFDVSAPFNYELIDTSNIVYDAADVTLIQSYSDYPYSTHNDYATIDPVAKTIDFGKDPILIVKGKSYILKSVCANWRTFNYAENTASSAIKILFNINTKLFRGVIYDATLTEGDVVIGAIRQWNANNVIASFPFEYKIKGELSEENKGQIRCKTSIDFIAHRGVVRNGIPENSLDAYRYAGYCGFKYAETDFCPTKDDELVLMHDASINRTMMNKSDYSEITGTVNVIDKTLQELRDNYVLKSTDIRFRREIPTLEEFFKTCKQSGVFPIAEIKTSGTTQEHVLQAYNLGKGILGEGNFGFTSFSNELLDYVRSLSEKTPLWYISTPIVGTVNSITNKSRESDMTIWFPEYNGLTEDNVKTHRNAGIKVSCWVVPVSDLDRILKLGVDIIAGDNLSPDINGLYGVIAKTDQNFGDFTTDGAVVDKILTLASGQTITHTVNPRWLGGYCISIIAKGNFKVTAPTLSSTVVSNKPERFIYQGLISGNFTFKIEAIDETKVEFIEISSVEF